MSESLEGVRVAATRQKGGRVENCEAAIAEPPGVGGVKAPAATVFADVIVVFGNLREARLSQGAARAGDGVRAAITRTARKPIRLWAEMTVSALTQERPARFMRAYSWGSNGSSRIG